ncbi:MAG: protein tyrosine phosphatase family protein [Acidiferrobacteraceae bacterium]
MQISKLNDEFYIGPQPTEPDLERLKAEGVRTVFDFRHPSETRVSSGPSATRQGLDYINIPIRLQALSDDDVDQFRREAETHPGPFLLHCGVGTRAAAMYLMKTAADHGWDAPRAFEEGQRIGVNFDGSPSLKSFVISYVTRHAAGGPRQGPDPAPGHALPK